MRHTDCDVVIVGAGVAGLSAAATLARAGQNIRCPEANGRVGGRILTVHDPLASRPIELGEDGNLVLVSLLIFRSRAQHWEYSATVTSWK